MSDVQDPSETVSDSGTETIQTDVSPERGGNAQRALKPKRKCTPAQLECLRRNREKALEVIRQKGEKARLAKELKDRYKQHVDTERDAEIQRLRSALAETKPAAKPAPKKRKRALSPSESESDNSPPPPPPPRRVGPTEGGKAKD